VVVRLATAGGAVAVAVRDYGVGLKPGEATRVFNRFWRADPARARTTGGTGLGLSIAVEDARLHGGWLQAWGEPGGGSQFRLTLPRTAGEALRGSPIPLEPADSRRNRAALAAGAGRRGASGSHRVAGGGQQGQAASGGFGRALPPVPAGPSRPPAADPAALPGSGARVVATPRGRAGQGSRPGSGTGPGGPGGGGGGGTSGDRSGGASRDDGRGEGGSGAPRGRQEGTE
jgi:two-component system sensor histidine kinase MtrB